MGSVRKIIRPMGWDGMGLSHPIRSPGVYACALFFVLILSTLVINNLCRRHHYDRTEQFDHLRS